MRSVHEVPGVRAVVRGGGLEAHRSGAPGRGVDTMVDSATEGRRQVARGKRPPILQAIKTVLTSAGRPLSRTDIIAGLAKREWLPVSKGDVATLKYIGELLSTGVQQGVFENVTGRPATYRVKGWGAPGLGPLIQTKLRLLKENEEKIARLRLESARIRAELKVSARMLAQASSRRGR